jgi:hypothetical protein
MYDGVRDTGEKELNGEEGMTQVRKKLVRKEES